MRRHQSDRIGGRGARSNVARSGRLSFLTDSSLLYLDTGRRFAQTWLPASVDIVHVPVLTFQNLIVRSAQPPPLARIEGCHGHHARALTAAKWSLNVYKGAVSVPCPVIAADHNCTKLSLPPLAR